MPRADLGTKRFGVSLIAGGLIASLLGVGAQLALAASVIGTVGMLHGASDLAVIRPERRVAFVAAYLVTAAAVLVSWRGCPSVALCLFLFLSAVHFAIEDAPVAAVRERLCRGLLMVFAPAMLHRLELAALFTALTGSPGASAAVAWVAACAGAVGLSMLPAALASAGRRQASGAAPLALGIVAALVLPPLTGFAVAFTLLHAWPQLRARVALTGSGTVPIYLGRHRLIIGGAVATVALTALLFAGHPYPAMATLFASLAALATPHMLITPLFKASQPRSTRHRSTRALANLLQVPLLTATSPPT